MGTGFVFAGQGAQSAGMGKDFYEKYEIAKKMFNKAEEIIPGIKKICFEGPEEELKLTKNAQPAIFILSSIIYEILKEKGIKPEKMAGFSLGECCAIYAAGIVDYETGLALVKKRGELMGEACKKNPGTMAAIIGLEDSIVEEVCKKITEEGKVVTPVNYNSPSQLVISGSIEGVEEAVNILKERGARRAVILKVEGAFHSPLMEEAREKFREFLETVEFKKPEIPVIFNATADEESEPEKIKELMIKQITSPVLWKQSISKMIKDGINKFIEIGPGKVLSGLIKGIKRDAETIITGTVENIEKLNV